MTQYRGSKTHNHNLPTPTTTTTLTTILTTTSTVASTNFVISTVFETTTTTLISTPPPITVATSTTVTATLPIATSTLYGACLPTSLLGPILPPPFPEAGNTIDDVLYDANTLYITTVNVLSSYDCCAACITSPTCAYGAWDTLHGLCYLQLETDGMCGAQSMQAGMFSRPNHSLKRKVCGMLTSWQERIPLSRRPV